jgi:hypothetical protein
MLLPDWIPREAWEGYLNMRKKIRKPLTDRAEAMALNRLAQLRQEGYDAQQVLEQSEFHCWVGLFPVHGGRAVAQFTDQHGNKYLVSAEGSRIYV